MFATDARRASSKILLRALVLSVVLAAPPSWAADTAHVVDLAIRKGALAEEARVVRVVEGDDVTLNWTTDVPLTIHLHGYDIEQKLAPGPPTPMRFKARATGRFPIEIHDHGGHGDRTLGYVEVHPR